MIRRPTGSTRTDTLVPDTTLGRAAGVVPGGLRRGVEDRPGCGGQRAHEYGGRHPRMIDPGILQFPVFDEHPDLHRLAYHFISLHFIGAAVRGSFIAMGSPSQDPARMAWRAPGPASAAPPVPEPHPGIREDRHWRRGRSALDRKHTRMNSST